MRRPNLLSFGKRPKSPLGSSSLPSATAMVRFVAGSGYDLIGTHAVGLRTYWHNRIGLVRPDAALPPDFESQNLDQLPSWLESAECK